VIAAILPTEVITRTALNDDSSKYLFPEEAAQIRHAVESRKREFATTRSLARDALQRLGFPAGPILQLPTRAPLWPAGAVGSITHCEAYRAVAVAKSTEFLSLGIDAEPHLPLPHEVLNEVSVESERAWLAHAPRGIHWDRLLFSAKESVYKACFPMTGRWLGFEDVMVAFEPNEKTFRAYLLAPPVYAGGRRITEFRGRFLVENDLMMTTIAIRRN
jgi:4'-phosphopantetheinyl transferase EntD